MTFTSENILLIGSVLVFVSILFTRSSFRFGIPVLLLFLGVGMLFGSDGLGVQFNSASDAQFIGMIALCLILFSGGMDTRFREIRPVLLPGISLSTVGVLLTTLFTGLFIYFISDYTRADIHLSLWVSFLLAATMSSTDSASVFNLLRSKNMNLKENLRPMLELESGSNDPMAYMLTIVLIQVVTLSGASAMDILKDFFLQFFLGALAGYSIGRFGVWLLNKISLVNSALYSILILSLVFFLFTVTDLIRGNAYLAVYVAGIVLGNAKIPYRKEVSNFLDGLTWFGQIVLFLTLGLLVNPHELWQVADVALLIAVGPSAQCVHQSAAVPELFVQIARIHFVGRFAWGGAHHLCHLSGYSRCGRRRTDIQHCVFHHVAFPAVAGYHAFASGQPSGTVRTDGAAARLLWY